jgi:hypothetical protein
VRRRASEQQRQQHSCVKLPHAWSTRGLGNSPSSFTCALCR